MSLIIRHSHTEGTLVEGTSRGDGSAEILKEVINPFTGRARAWRWSRNLGSWYVQRSRDAAANSALIEATANALRAAGFEVEIAIDDRYRAPAEVEADVVARQAGRAAALDAKAVQAAAGSEAADVQARELAERMPLGQPILVGHHSEGRMRRAYRDIEKASRASVAAYREAQTAQARADIAASTTAVRYSPAVIRRRIERLDADLRRWQRTRDGVTRTLYIDAGGVKHVEITAPATGARLTQAVEEIERLQGWITFWKQQLEAAAAEGAQIWTAAHIEVGDQVRCAIGWRTVIKVNTKSVRVQSVRGRLPFDAIHAVKTADGRQVTIVDGARSIADDPAPGP